MSRRAETLMAYYNAMAAHFGSSHWWPADSPFEVAVGAMLTQNTAWSNVEKAIASLKQADKLHPARMLEMPEEELASLIRSAGYYRLKTTRLRNLLGFLAEEASRAGTNCLDDLKMEYLAEYSVESLREKLLAVSGIGPETADSILLYALKKPSFVVDTYTRRIFSRHALVEPEIEYAELRDFFMDVLPQELALYNEYHALIVKTGNNYCLKGKGRCEECPLRNLLEYEPDF